MELNLKLLKRKLVVFCDDICLFPNSIKDMKLMIEIVQLYEKSSNTKVNLNKSSYIQVGGDLININNNEIDIIPINGKHKYCGIYFNKNGTINIFDQKIEQMKDILKNWKKFNLSIIGKIQILKSFLLFQNYGINVI